MPKKQTIAVATVLNKNLDAVWAHLGTGTVKNCYSTAEFIEKLLNEEPRVPVVQKQRCVNILKKSAHNPKLFMSSLVGFVTCISVSKDSNRDEYFL